MQPLTLAQMRDRIRRQIGKTPAVDLRELRGKEGDPSPSQPRPSNATINMAVQNAVSRINREVGFFGGIRAIPISVPAQSTSGPYYVNLADGVANYVGAASINQVRHVHWVTTGETSNLPLEGTAFSILDRDYPSWPTTEVGTPTHFSVEGYSLILWPSPSSAGTLTIFATSSLQAPEADNQTLQLIPADYYPIVIDVACAELLSIDMGDLVMVERGKVLIPRGEYGIQQIMKWTVEQNQDLEPVLSAASHTGYRGGRWR